jgi:hypothetical protein
MKTNSLTMLQKSRFGAYASTCFNDGGDDDTVSDDEGCPDMPDYADPDSQA